MQLGQRANKMVASVAGDCRVSLEVAVRMALTWTSPDRSVL